MTKFFKFIHYLFYILLISTLTFFYPSNSVYADSAPIDVSYAAQVQNIGWMNSVKGGTEAGTDGKGLRVEALNINLINAPSGAKIDYQVHVQNIGWEPWKQNGVNAGTVGKGLRIEAIRIKLENLPGYSVQYEAHVQNIGWQPFVSDGDEAGTDGKGLRVEALIIKIVPKVTSLSLNKSADTLTAGDTDTLTASISPANATTAILNWTSSNNLVAKVDDSGKITAVSGGFSTITVLTEDRKTLASCVVTVNDPTVAFKDNSLEKVIRTAINKPTGTLFKSDVVNITDLDSENYSGVITYLDGIENLINLNTLQLNNNKIKDISDLKSLSNLRVVYLNDNEISDISVLKYLPNIQYLELGNNGLTDITGVKSLTNLQHLELMNNSIKDVSPIKALANLQYLNLYNNQINDISAIKSLPGLQYLNLYNNGLSDISSLNSLTNLSELILGNNKITNAKSLYSLTKLIYVDLSNNQINNTDIQSLKNALPNVNIGF